MPSVFGVTEAMTGGALVNVFLDGTAVVHHGGIEMGQGIHIKMAQIAAGVLRIPLSDVRVAETSTDVVPNTSKTAAAAGTDVNGGAVEAAANELAARLAPFREALATTTHEPSMAEVAQAAHAASSPLPRQGFFGRLGSAGQRQEFFRWSRAGAGPRSSDGRIPVP